MNDDPKTTKPEYDLRSIARELDCITEEDLITLAGDVLPSTPDAWRRRHIGPAYIRFGKAYLYPKKLLAEYLRDNASAKERSRHKVAPKDVL